jgi:hypothetical protein
VSQSNSLEKYELQVSQSSMKTQTNADLMRAAAEMEKYHRCMKLTLAPLQSDMDFALEHLISDQKNQQFWRRTIIRCLLAYTEALLWNLKNGIPIISSISGIELTSSDLDIIREKRTVEINGQIELRPKFLKFRDNLKETFTLVGKVHGTNFSVNCDQDFDALCETYDLRSRLMHPKKPMDPNVSDLNMAASQQGIKWLSFESNRLIEQCIQSIPKVAKRV